MALSGGGVSRETPPPISVPEGDVSRETSRWGGFQGGECFPIDVRSMGHVSSCVGNVGTKKPPNGARPDPRCSVCARREIDPENDYGRVPTGGGRWLRRLTFRPSPMFPRSRR